MKFSFSSAQNGIVFGAGRGIGLGVVKALLTQTTVHIIAVYRSDDRAEELVRLQYDHSDRITLKRLNPESEEELGQLAESIDELDYIINSIGLLHSESVKPERKVEDCSLEHMVEVFKVNAVITALIAKTFLPLFKKKSPTLFSAVSAKVGSIEDNRLGGWYSYRVSKAALNMLLKNIAIEFSRRATQTSVVSIHPGTTLTDLSKPFVGKTNYQLHDIEDTGRNIINVLDQTEVSGEAKFLSWTGDPIAW